MVSCDPSHSGNRGNHGPIGGNSVGEVVEDPLAMYRAGQFLRTSSEQTSYFSQFPQVGAQPDKVVGYGEDVRVIALYGQYVRVELMNTGDVGYVPMGMLEKRGQGANMQAGSQQGVVAGGGGAAAGVQVGVGGSSAGNASSGSGAGLDPIGGPDFGLPAE